MGADLPRDLAPQQRALRGKRPLGQRVLDPLLGINYLQPFGKARRFSGFFASTIPVGSGGGAAPDKGAEAAMAAAIWARSGMDNSERRGLGGRDPSFREQDGLLDEGRVIGDAELRR